MATLSSQDTTTTTTQNTSANPPSHLAKLLADALADAESLRDELNKQKKRAEDAERLASALQTVHGDSNGTSVSSPPSAQRSVNTEQVTHLITEFQARAERAERERDEEFARRSAISDAWRQLNEYLESVDFAVKDMRAGFHRIVLEGGGVLSPVTIPIPKQRLARSYQPSTPFPALPLPPVPPTRRQRTPSLEAHGQPPAKRQRGEYSDHSSYPPPTQQSSYPPQPPQPVSLPPQQPRIIFASQSQQPRNQYPPPPAHQFVPQQGQPSRKHRRSASGSSGESNSVDEMILDAADGSQPANGHSQTNDSASIRSRKRRGTSHERGVTYESHHRMSGHAQLPPPIPRNDSNNASTTSVYRYQNGSLHQLAPAPNPDNSQSLGSGQREIQMHVFAPVVTGAPQKKSKFSGGAIPSLSTNSIGGTSLILSGPSTAAADSANSPPSGSFPAQNDQGQRICRQCGMSGRYKDGKCVEKWGPGPCGPGTVCDRCRKKMKRVERRGTMDQIAHQTLQQQSSAQRQAYGSQPLTFSPVPTMHAQSQSQSQPQSSTALTRTDTLPANFEQSQSSQSQSQPSPPPPRVIQHAPASSSNGRSLSPYRSSPASTSTHGVDAEIPTSSIRDGPPEKVAPRLPQPGPRSRQTSRSRTSRSPVNTTTQRRGSGATQSTDFEDADGEADGDVEAEAAVNEKKAAATDVGEKEGRSKSADGDGEGEEEAELLEAVDAAEAASIASSS